MNSSVFKKIQAKISWSAQIKYRLIIAIGLVHFICMLLFVFFRLIQQEIFFKQQSREHVIDMAETLANNANSYIISSNWDGLQRLIQSHKNFPHLKYAMILSDKNMVLAHTNSSFMGTTPVDTISTKIRNASQNIVLVDNKFILDIAVPVFDPNKNINGWVRIAISQQYIYDDLFKLARSGLIAILISFALISLTVSLLITKLVNEFYKLIGVADQIKSGNREIRVSEMKSFETTKVGLAFNEMLDSIDEHERLLTTVLGNLPVGVCLLNEKGETFFYNEEFKKIWSGENLLNDTAFHEAINRHSQPGIARVLQEGEMIVKEELEIECLDKTKKDIQTFTVPLTDKSHKIIGAINVQEDITERKRLEVKQLTMTQDIIQRNNSLEQFSYILSHNIRGPLSNILGLKEALKMDLKQGEKKMLIDNISDSAEAMDHVIKDVSSILQIRHGNFVEQENVSLYDLVQDIKDDLGHAIIEKKVTIETDFSATADLFSIKNYLRDIFYNLIMNAIKFSKTGIPPEIRIWSEVKNDAICIHFKDFGIGIDMDRHKNEIFKLYKRFHLTVAGKGLGLFMTKSQIEFLGGEITVYSELGEWTEFVVKLPRKAE